MAAFTYVKCTSPHKSFKRPRWPLARWDAEMKVFQPLVFNPMVQLTLMTEQTKPYERAWKIGPQKWHVFLRTILFEVTQCFWKKCATLTSYELRCNVMLQKKSPQQAKHLKMTSWKWQNRKVASLMDNLKPYICGFCFLLGCLVDGP